MKNSGLLRFIALIHHIGGEITSDKLNPLIQTDKQTI